LNKDDYLVIKPTTSFIQNVLNAFRRINGEITIDTLEHDFSPRLAKYFIEAVLGYEGREYTFERGRTDITLFDENDNRVVVIETKRPRENLDTEQWQNQAGKYADSSTRYVGLTNGYRFILWEVADSERVLRTDINFKELIDTKRFNEEKLSTGEVGQILSLNSITKEQIWSEDKYSKFDEYYAKIEVAEEEGFNKLIKQLNFISNEILKQYTYTAFDEYYAGYAQYKQTKDELDEIKKQTNGNKKQAAEVARYELKTEGKFKKYASFSGYYIWKAISNRPDDKEEENKQIFCKESIYVLINRLLFIRICEDKGLLSKKISNGGMEKLREQLYEPAMPDNGVFKQIVFFSYNGANNLYYHFYEKDNPLDWYESGDGDLDRVLNRVLWILNQFNFSKVDRDVLGKLYEKYLPKEERKALGEFYTPDEVIDYILDAIGYTPSKAIEAKDLIDPACGSGGFLVRATRRLIARHTVKLGKATPKEALDNKRWRDVYDRLTPKECEEIVNSVALHIHGFDINPFAVNITEMNLLFQIIDLYFKAVKGNKTFRVPRFKVYETDSLEMPTEQLNMTQFYGATGKNLAKDKDMSDELKKKKYDFVVGNPPYVKVQSLPSIQKSMLEKSFKTAKGLYDLYTLFVELGINKLGDNGKLGYIISDKFIQRGYGEVLKTIIAEQTTINEIIDFGDTPVFEGVTNYPLILVIAKPNDPDYKSKIIKVKKENSDILKIISNTEKDSEDNYIMAKFVKHSDFIKDWSFSNERLRSAFNNFVNVTPLRNLCESIQVGIQTGNDDLLLFQKDFVKNDMDSKFLVPYVKGREVKRYSTPKPKFFVLYPYILENNKQRLITESELKLNPKLYNYLISHKNELDKRWGVKTYYDLATARTIEWFKRRKILTPDVSALPNFTIIDGDLYFSKGSCYGIVLKQNKLYEYILGLLNSKLLFAIMKDRSALFSGGYYRFTTDFMEHLPIKLPENKKEEAIAEKITVLVKELLKIKKKDEGMDTNTLEKKVDELVFELYNVPDSIRKIIENDS
jgi:type I restriction-modification system DNA methylase subunit